MAEILRFMSENCEKKLSVIIVSYINLEIVVDCLNSVNKYNDIGRYLEVILVDNSPENNIYDTIVRNFPNVTVIKNNNKGFGEANNVGSRTATGKYLLFLNPDTILIEPLFSFAINMFEQNDKLGMFGVKLVDMDRKWNMSFYSIDGGGILNSVFIKGCNFFNIYIDKKMYVSGANLFIKKDVFIKAGMFDENIFLYYEEPDLTRRLHAIGQSTGYFKEKKLIHLEGKASLGTVVSLRRRLDSAIYYNEKYSRSSKKQFKKEIRYYCFKIFILKILRRQGGDTLRENISVLREYLM